MMKYIFNILFFGTFNLDRRREKAEPVKGRSSMIIKIFAIIMLFSVDVFAVADIDDKKYVTVDSIAMLAQYAAGDDAYVKLAPGVYNIDDTSTAQEIMLKKYKDGKPTVDYPVSCLLNFSGSSNVFELKGTVINIDTKLHRAFGKTHLFEIFVSGNGNVIKGLKVRDVGDTVPSGGAIMMHVMGDNNVISGADLFIQGSSPYGYGHLLGKGGGALVGLYKHSSLLVTGKNNTLLGCKVVTRAFGHGIVMQGAVDTFIKDCYVEGEMRPTDEMLAETSGLAKDVNFKSIYPPGRIVPGEMKALSEDGIRTYPSGAIFGRKTENVTVVNCTVKNMRSAFDLSATSGKVVVSGCEVIGCQEKGYSLPSGGIITGSRGDAMYGPLLSFIGTNINNCYVELELVKTESKYPPTHLAEINGSGHTIILKNYNDEKRETAVPIVFGDSFWAQVHRFRNPQADPAKYSFAKDITLINKTTMPVAFTELSSDCRVITDGELTSDKGKDNKVEIVISNQ
jgi:hypothetical protein